MGSMVGGGGCRRAAGGGAAEGRRHLARCRQDADTRGRDQDMQRVSAVRSARLGFLRAGSLSLATLPEARSTKAIGPFAATRGMHGLKHLVQTLLATYSQFSLPIVISFWCKA